MNGQPKIRRRIKLKRKHKTSHTLTFLRHKRVSPSLSVKKKSKEKKWEMQFKKLEENIDLNSWTFEELKQCVSEFQKQQKDNNSNNIQLNKSSMKNFLFSNNNNNIKNNINNINNQNYIQSINENIQKSNFGSQNGLYSQYNNKNIIKNTQQVYKKEIPCKTLDKNELNSKKYI